MADSSQLVRQFLCLLLVPATALAQPVDEVSIPEPTDFDVFAAAEGAQLTVVAGSENSVDGDAASFDVAAVEIRTSEDEVRQGVRILLIEGDETEQILLDRSQAVQLKTELAGFQKKYDSGEPCTAAYLCLRGVARCRPSQTETQAVCPEYYTTPDGRQGIRVGSYNSPADFPNADPSVFVNSIAVAIDVLDVQHAH